MTACSQASDLKVISSGPCTQIGMQGWRIFDQHVMNEEEEKWFHVVQTETSHTLMLSLFWICYLIPQLHLRLSVCMVTGPQCHLYYEARQFISVAKYTSGPGPMLKQWSLKNVAVDHLYPKRRLVCHWWHHSTFLAAEALKRLSFLSIFQQKSATLWNTGFSVFIPNSTAYTCCSILTAYLQLCYPGRLLL